MGQRVRTVEDFVGACLDGEVEVGVHAGVGQQLAHGVNVLDDVRRVGHACNIERNSAYRCSNVSSPGDSNVSTPWQDEEEENYGVQMINSKVDTPGHSMQGRINPSPHFFISRMDDTTKCCVCVCVCVWWWWWCMCVGGVKLYTIRQAMLRTQAQHRPVRHDIENTLSVKKKKMD